MTKQELKTKLAELEKEMADLKAAMTKIDEEEPKFERRKGREYYTVGTYRGNAECYELVDDAISDSDRYENNNYFYTEERAQEVADKINFLRKLERLHDIYCPDYVPNWEDDKQKWYLFYDEEDNEYKVASNTIVHRCVEVYFDSDETADKVCDILNKEREEND